MSGSQLNTNSPGENIHGDPISSGALRGAESSEDAALQELKKKMSPQQQRDMAELIGNELKRREAMKQGSGSQIGRNSSVPASAVSGRNLSSDDLTEVYANADRDIQSARVRALEQKVKAAKRETKRLNIGQSRSMLPQVVGGNGELARYVGGHTTRNMPAILFICALLFVLALKVGKELHLFETGGIQKDQPTQARAALSAPTNTEVQMPKQDAVQAIMTPVIGGSSDLEKSLLLQLDRRRVELEQRREILDKKESELGMQARLVTEKVTELKTLINKLSVLRKEKDSKYDARLEQLASVYSAMNPKEASGLIAKLDEEIALGLLERLSGKRMAQILGGMNQERALELTKLLTNKKKL